MRQYPEKKNRRKLFLPVLFFKGDESVKLSIVIPAFNEEKRIIQTLNDLKEYYPESEIIVVDDGSSDSTAEISALSGARVFVHKENRGKGAAVRTGVLAARGDVIGFMDADLAVPVHCLESLLKIMEKGADVAIGSRGMPGSKVYGRSVYRNLPGKIFSGLVSLATGLPYADTQCGFKFFKRTAARKIFTEMRTADFAFDVEVLFRARKLGCKVVEMPVEWHDRKGSTVHVFHDGAKMIRSLFRICAMRRLAERTVSAKQYLETRR